MTRLNAILSAFAAIGLSLAALSAPAFAEKATAETQAQAEVLHNGQWAKKTYRASGDWTIYTESGKTYVKLSSDFRTRNAPDLKLFLSPRAAADANGDNATDGSVLILPLSSNRGEQVYEIPASVDLADYKSILIHCERFSKLWSAADLA